MFKGVHYFGFGNVTPVVTANSALRLDNIQFAKSNLAVQNAMNSNFIVYPNPVHSLLHLQTEEIIKRHEVFTSDGKLVKAG